MILSRKLRTPILSLLFASSMAIPSLVYPAQASAWSWSLGDSPDAILSIFKKGDPTLVPRRGSSTELPCGIYTDYDAHPTDRFLFYSPTPLGQGKMTIETGHLS